MKALILSCLGILIGFTGNAQTEISMADQFREDGKIYVVIAVVLVILLGLVIYLFTLDRKISALEKSLKK